MLDQSAIDLSMHRLEKAKDLLDQSGMLLQGHHFDGNINRSYYAIFNAIRTLLALHKLDSSKHSGVIGFFDRYFVKTGLFDKIWSKIVHSAFDARQVSDYDDKPSVSKERAECQLQQAKEFIAEVEIKRAQFIEGQLTLSSL